MKHLAFLLATFVITSNLLSAQNPQSQNKILKIDYFDHIASDIGVTNSKNVIEIKEGKLVINSNKEIYPKEGNNYRLKNGKIIYKQYKEQRNSIEVTSNFYYNTNDNLLEKLVIFDKRENKEELLFIYDNKERLIEIKKNGSFNDKYFEYDDINNIINIYELGFENPKKNSWSFKTNKNGNIISKTCKDSLYPINDKYQIYSYDGDNISSVSQLRNIDDALTESEAKNNYTYNKKGLVTSEKGDLSLSIIRYKFNTIYEYEYDKYGNWFVKYEFLIPYDEEELKEHDYKHIQSIIIRKISYKIGNTTENTFVDQKTIENYLKKEATNLLIKN